MTHALELKLINEQTRKGITIMKISRIKLIAKYLTGGLTNVVEYILDLFNEYLQRLPAAEVANYAQLAKDVACLVQNLAAFIIKDDAKKRAAQITASAFADLATALLDSNLTRSELDQIISSAKDAIAAWKAA